MEKSSKQIKTNLGGGYINKRISDINRGSERLKEEQDSKENLKIQRSLRLVLNENKTEGEKLFDKIKKNYIEKEEEEEQKRKDKTWRDTEEEIKETIKKAKENYHMDDNFIEQIVKVIYNNRVLSNNMFLENLIDFCHIRNIYNVNTLKENKDIIERLILIELKL